MRLFSRVKTISYASHRLKTKNVVWTGNSYDDLDAFSPLIFYFLRLEYLTSTSNVRTLAHFSIGRRKLLVTRDSCKAKQAAWQPLFQRPAPALANKSTIRRSRRECTRS